MFSRKKIWLRDWRLEGWWPARGGGREGEVCRIVEPSGTWDFWRRGNG